jgi:ATP-dependent metalloprotease
MLLNLARRAALNKACLASGNRGVTQVSRNCTTKQFTRGLHFQWNFSWKDYKAESALLGEANASPLDAEKQASLLKQINKHNPSKVVERVESGKYANSEATLREYIKALYKEDKLENLALAGMVPAPNVLAPAAGMGFNAPVRVQFVRNKWENYIIFAVVAGILVIVIASEYGRETNPMPMFNVPSSHRRMSEVAVTFDDVKGCDEAKMELQEVVEYLRTPEKFDQAGARLPKGVLMCGPPGTGKTLLARAMAGEAGVGFLYIAGSAFDEVYVGVGSKRVRQLFKDAQESAPCIVFIDEIDAVGNSRENASSKDNTLQQLLTELDGFSSTKGVVVIAATNTPETLDPALVRPGRFDKQVYVQLPDVSGRKQIFDHYLKRVSHSGIDSEVLARSTPGFSGADISQLINSSAIKSVVKGKEAITMDLIDEARDDILMGRERRNVLIDDKTRQMTAYHEGGHALVAFLTQGADPLHKATIIQRGNSLGMVKQLPEGDQLSFSRQQMEARLAVLMGGRAAEELIYGAMGTTSGASSDLMQASKLATKMVKEWGFSEKVGLMFISDRVSQQTEQMIDEEVRSLLQKQYNYAMNVLKDNKPLLDGLAKELLNKETLAGEDINKLLKSLKQEKL